MAAIIARITKEKRDRDLRLSKEIKSSKSNYELKPFQKNFQPETENKETDFGFWRQFRILILYP
jgi:hypothetical protein